MNFRCLCTFKCDVAIYCGLKLLAKYGSSWIRAQGSCGVGQCCGARDHWNILRWLCTRCKSTTASDCYKLRPLELTAAPMKPKLFDWRRVEHLSFRWPTVGRTEVAMIFIAPVYARGP